MIWSEIRGRARRPDSRLARQLRGFSCHYLGNTCTAWSLMFCCHVARRSPSHYSLFNLLFRRRCVVFFGEAAVILANKYKITHDVFSFSPLVCVLILWLMHQDALHLPQKRAASNLEPLWINEKAEKQTSGKEQQTCNSLSPASGWKTACVSVRKVSGALPWQVREAAAALEHWNLSQCGSRASPPRPLF